MTADWPNPRMPFALSTARPPIAPPTPGRGLLVNIALNVEHWPFDRPMPRGILPAPHGIPAEPPDVANYAWVDYGLRAGMPRILRILTERGLRASAFVNADIATRFPALFDAILAGGHELVGHCILQRSLKTVPHEEEEITQSLAILRRASGQDVEAWLGPGFAETLRTPDLLREHGVLYLHDWTVDDLPVWMRTSEGPMLAMPYALDLNDVVVYAVQAGASEEWERRLDATLAVLGPEAAETPRVLTLALHPHIAGVPHVAHRLARMLDTLLARPDTAFMTSATIGAWYSAQDPAGAEAVML